MRTATAANMSPPVEVPQPIPRAASISGGTAGLVTTSRDEGVRLETAARPPGTGRPPACPSGWRGRRCRTRPGRRSRRRPGHRSGSAAGRSARRGAPDRRRAGPTRRPRPPAGPARSRDPPRLRRPAGTRRPAGSPPAARMAATKAAPSTWSPCQVPSALRRATLTEPRNRARSVRVAQCAASPNLCGTVAIMPPTLPDGLSPRDQRVEIVGRDLQRDDDGVATPGGEGAGDAVGGFHLRDRVADDRHDQGLAGQDRVGVHEISIGGRLGGGRAAGRRRAGRRRSRK